MKQIMKAIRYDLYRMRGRTDTVTLVKTFLTSRVFRRVFYFRKYQEAGRIGKQAVKLFNHFLFKRMSLELPWTVKLGKGVLFLHPYSITFNGNCVIGDNCTIMKGVTIGNTKTGKVGTPIIGDNVYIGLNSTVVGGIVIGNDVMIAPNTFVNFDVPDGALVLGSPGVVHPKTKASAPYIVNSIEKMGEL